MNRTIFSAILVIAIILNFTQSGLAQDVAVSEKAKTSSTYKLPTPTDINAVKFLEIMKKEGVTVLDIRTLREFQAGHIENAVNVDWYQRSFRDGVLKLDKNKKILIYCHSGNRSDKAKYMLIGLGFTQVYNLEYGINDWYRNKFKLIK